MATYQSSIVSAEPIFLDPQRIAAQIMREVFPPAPPSKKVKVKAICCACGCGKPVRIVDGKPNRYLNHHRRIPKPRQFSERLNANTVEILRDAKAGRVQLYASRKASLSGVFWIFASAFVGTRELDDRRGEFARMKPYLLLSENRTTRQHWVFDVVRLPSSLAGEGGTYAATA
jgi:hypothetical protein